MISYCKDVIPASERTSFSLFRSTKGYALPGVLVVSTMASLLVLIITQLTRDVIFLARDTKEVLSERYKPILLPKGATDNSECAPFTAPPVMRLLCHTAPRVFKTYPKIAPSEQRRFIDFNGIFSQPNTCFQAIRSISPIQGRLPASPLTCNVREYASERVALRESLLSNKIILLPTKNRSAALLASLGDINIQGELILSTDSVIVAAGSIRIKGIFSNDTTHRKITLIASSGDILIDHLSPLVFPLAFGRASLSIPAVRLNPPYPMVIEKKRVQISGITLPPHVPER